MVVFLSVPIYSNYLRYLAFSKKNTNNCNTYVRIRHIIFGLDKYKKDQEEAAQLHSTVFGMVNIFAK